MNMSLLIPKGDTLVTYYLLPLIGVNKKTFGGKFRKSYADRKLLYVYVELKSPMESPTYKDHMYYITEMIIKDKIILVFQMPANFLNDYLAFSLGRYSEMSKEAKNLIYATSTLPFNKKMGKFSMSHPVLQALDKTKTLRKFLTEFFGVEVLADTGELIDAPSDDWFIDSLTSKK